MAEPNNDNAVLFATYVTLYVNDIACNAIREIKPFVGGKDKETIKIWGALSRRVECYFNSVRKNVKLNGSYFLSNINEVFDGYADEPMNMLTSTIKGCLRKYNVEDDGIIIKTIISHILTEFAVSTTETLCDGLKKGNIPYKGLLPWQLKEVRRVTRNFYFWVCRKVDDDMIAEMKRLVETITPILTSAICQYEHFERAYEYAIKEEKREYERNN